MASMSAVQSNLRAMRGGDVSMNMKLDNFSACHENREKFVKNISQTH